MEYKVNGKFKMGYTWEKFTKNVSSQNKKNAIEKIYSIIGSQHHLERRLIKIENVSEINTKDE